jgi:hypothetical protein
MKKYQISPAQLIELIKNNHIKSSLMNSTSVNQLIKRKQMINPHFFLRFRFVVRPNFLFELKNINFSLFNLAKQNKDGDDTKTNDDNDGGLEDKPQEPGQPNKNGGSSNTDDVPPPGLF